MSPSAAPLTLGEQQRKNDIDALNIAIATEAKAGVRTSAFYAGFQAKADRVKNELLAFLIAAKILR